jgi:plastocyanin
MHHMGLAQPQGFHMISGLEPLMLPLALRRAKGGVLVRSIQAAAAAALSLMVPPAAQGQPAQVIVQLWNFGFAPSPLHLTAGRPVTLRFVNQSGSSHDFTAPAFFQHSTLTSGAAPGGEVDLKGHETKVITLIPNAGTYEAHCSHFLHKQMGMNDVIVVN